MLFLLFLVALQPLHGSAQDSCDPPDCSTATKPDQKLEDPLDCHNYYVCLGTEGSYTVIGPVDCPDDYYFDTKDEDCKALNGSWDCEPRCSGGNSGECSFNCGIGSNEFKVDRYDCSSYYACTDEKVVIPCPPETPFFNGEVCQTDESACCHCRPYCTADDASNDKVMDPLDCTRYYYCTAPDTVPEYPGTCPAGDHFDIFDQECSSTAPCLTLCTNVINQDGCIDVFTCEEVGYFASCPKGCGPTYYRCYDDDIGNIIEAETCPEGKVFDPNKTTCVAESECTPITSRH